MQMSFKYIYENETFIKNQFGNSIYTYWNEANLQCHNILQYAQLVLLIFRK